MILHRESRSSRSGESAPPATPAELGRALRRIRTRRGLRLEDVSARSGLPLEHLEVLESGVLKNVRDPVSVLRTLRLYAASLGLPGDRVVLELVEHWPAYGAGPGRSPHPSQVPPSREAEVENGTASSSRTGSRPAALLADPDAQPSADDGITEDVTHPDAEDADQDPASGEVPADLAEAEESDSDDEVWDDEEVTGAIPAVAAHATSRNTATRGHMIPQHMVVADTGITAAVSSVRRSPAQRKPDRAPVGLWIVVIVVGLAVVLGTAGLVVNHYKPNFLSSIGIGSSKPSNTTTTTASKTRPSTHHPGKTTYALSVTSPTSALITVHAPIYLVDVQAVNAPSWMQASTTTPGAIGVGPGGIFFSGTTPAGQTKFFFVQHTAKLVIGSIAAHITISVGKKMIGTYLPTAAPFTITFATA